jgi:hypothetical protein
MELVRIDDLREPRRSPQEQAVHEWGLQHQVDLGVDGIVADARAATGKHGLDDPTVLDRLAVQAAAVDADEGLSGLGRMIVRNRLVGLLAARLRFDDFVRREVP